MIHYNLPRQRQVQEEEEKGEEEESNLEEEITIPSHNRTQSKQERVECMKCHKPAVRYRGHEHPDGSVDIIYEHRDEPPIASFVYKGVTMYRYRRCCAGKATDGLKVIFDAGIPEGEELPEIPELDDHNNDPPASDMIVDIQKQRQRQRQKSHNNDSRAKRPHSPSMREIGGRLNVIREEQRKIFKELNAIRTIMEMMIKGDLTLTPKSLGETHGIG